MENTIKRLHFPNIFWLGLVHIIILAAPFYFTWPAFILCLVGVFLVSPFGVNLGFHRLLAHRSLRVPKWLEYTLVTIGAVIAGGPPLHWVAEHRLHHQFSDTPQDPHDANNGFWYAHITHLFWHKDFEDIEEQWMKYVPDLSSDAYYRFLNRYWVYLAALTVIPLYWAGGMPFVMWGGFVRVALMLHCTWFVNSATHMFGYRNYETRDKSTNCWWVGLLAAGEGWHNNHHAYPNSAAHGHSRSEFDLTYLIIRILEKLGLAKDVRLPPKSALAFAKNRALATETR